MSSSGLRFISLEPANADAWDRLCAASDGSWFWHTTTWLDYAVSRLPESGTQLRAFLALDGPAVVGICPLVLEPRCADDETVALEYSVAGEGCLTPALAPGLAPRRRDAVLRAMLAHADERARRDGVRRMTFRGTPLSRASAETDHMVALLRAGYLDVSRVTQVVDLTMTEAELWRGMRDGHRSDISRGDPALEVRTIDQEGFDPAAFDEYVRVHAKAAGRATRATRTFELMASWIAQGNAALFLADRGGAAIGAAYVVLYKAGACYASAANDPDVRDLPVGHVLQWATLRWLRAHGIERYELGMQALVPLPHQAVTAKERAISLFKRGFGGRAERLLIMEKYFDPDFYLSEQRARASKYAGTLRSVAAEPVPPFAP